MTVESHLQRRSRKGDGRNKVEVIASEGTDSVAMEGRMGVLDDELPSDTAMKGAR
jgi:hypothetical protein